MAFYASTVAILTLIFAVINYAFPKVVGAYPSYPSISLQVATLIVGFPLFLFLSWLIQKTFVTDPTLRDSAIRRWLAYITLFIAGAIIAGDLVTVIYYFLDGQDLTTGFLLKVLTLLVVASGIFIYYWREIRNRIMPGERNAWRIGSALFIIASIVLGFMVIGSPATQRARRYDEQRVSDLQNIQWQIVSYFQRKNGALPSTLSDLNDSISGFKAPVDPRTGAQYEYTLIGQSAKAFELCATFDTESKNSQMQNVDYPTYGLSGSDNWAHGVGHQCFTRSIDPELYPPVPKTTTVR